MAMISDKVSFALWMALSRCAFRAAQAADVDQLPPLRKMRSPSSVSSRSDFFDLGFGFDGLAQQGFQHRQHGLCFAQRKGPHRGFSP